MSYNNTNIVSADAKHCKNLEQEANLKEKMQVIYSDSPQRQRLW